MTDSSPQFEGSDVLGTSTGFPGTVGTSWTAVPASPGTPIQSYVLICSSEQAASRELYVSYDAGTTIAATIYPGGVIDDKILGRPTQFHIKGSVAGVIYELILHREAA